MERSALQFRFLLLFNLKKCEGHKRLSETYGDTALLYLYCQFLCQQGKSGNLDTNNTKNDLGDSKKIEDNKLLIGRELSSNSQRPFTQLSS